MIILKNSPVLLAICAPLIWGIHLFVAMAIGLMLMPIFEWLVPRFDLDGTRSYRHLLSPFVTTRPAIEETHDA